MKKVLIVGSGVAGLAIGEIFARNKYQVVVAERDNELGGSSSRAMQNWFHTGNLYLHSLSGGLSRRFFSTSRLFAKLYPAATPENNVVNISADGLATDSARQDRWVNSSNPIYYCYARRGMGIPRPLQFVPMHHFWLKNVMVPRLVESNRPFSFEEPDALKAALSGAGGAHAQDDFHILKSSDATLYSSNILRTLAASCASNGAALLTGADVRLSRASGSATDKSSVVAINGNRERFDMVFLAAGADNTHLLNALGPSPRVRNLYAPILVANRKLFPFSFAIISPNRDDIFHHILYQSEPGARSVSTISGCTNVPAPNAELGEEFMGSCMRRFDLHAQDIVGIYWGCKTEQANHFRRNYLSALNEVDASLHWVLPGKFTLFPYLVDLAITRFGLTTPAIEFDSLATQHIAIGQTMVQKMLKGLG